MHADANEANRILLLTELSKPSLASCEEAVHLNGATFLCRISVKVEDNKSTMKDYKWTYAGRIILVTKTGR